MQEANKTWYNTIAFTFSDSFKRLHKFWQTTLIVFVVFLFTIKFAGKDIGDLFERIIKSFMNYQTVEEKQLEYMKLVKYVDSIKSEERILKTNKNFDSKYEIKKELVRIKESNPDLLAVSYISIHNGGQELKVDNNYELDVFISSNNLLEKDFNKDSKDKSDIWSGLLYWGKKIKDEGIFYFEDLENYPELYTGALRGYLRSRGVQSVHSIYVGNDGRNLLYISLDYSVKNVSEYESAIILRRLRGFIKERIDL